jgi:type II secretory pathway pseudopilin PulG
MAVPHKSSSRQTAQEQGYIMLTLMLMVAMLVIAAAVCAPTIAFEIRRDREEEMVHRGVQYTRAIRAYYKKLGRYPTSLKDLDNTNNLRYLRKHYKDPISGQDFKLLHYGDPGVTLGGSFGGAGIAGANTVSQLNAAQSGSAFGSSPGGFGGGSGTLGGSSGAGGGFGGGGGSFGGNSSFGGGSSFGGNSNSGFGSNSNNSGNSPGTSQQPDPTQAGTTSPNDPNAPQNGANGTNSNAGTSNSSAFGSPGQTFGGGAIIGVASVSKKDTIREYNKKHKYNEWQFVYDPTLDRGGLITTPYQPQLAMSMQNLNGSPNTTNPAGSAFGSPNSSGFGQQNGPGQSSGFGNNSSGFGNSNSGFGSSPSPPQSNPQPQ